MEYGVGSRQKSNCWHITCYVLMFSWIIWRAHSKVSISIQPHSIPKYTTMRLLACTKQCKAAVFCIKNQNRCIICGQKQLIISELRLLGYFKRVSKRVACEIPVYNLLSGENMILSLFILVYFQFCILNCVNNARENTILITLPNIDVRQPMSV